MTARRPLRRCRHTRSLADLTAVRSEATTKSLRGPVDRGADDDGIVKVLDEGFEGYGLLGQRGSRPWGRCPNRDSALEHRLCSVMRSAEVVRLDRHPRAPESRQLGLSPGRRRKNYRRLGYEQRDRDLLQPRQGQDQSRVDYARCCGRQNRRDKSMPAPHQRRYRTHHSTRVWSVQACSTPLGRMSPMPPGGKSFFLAPIPVRSG